MITQLLSQIALFSSLPRPEIERLAGTLRTRQAPSGALLFAEGKTDSYCLIIQEGKVEIIKSLGTTDERILAIRETGTLLGEMNLFTPEHGHTASVRALTPLTVLEMTRKDFNDLLYRQPELAYKIAQIMSQRLAESENLTILDLREKNRQLTLAYEELKAAHEQIVEKELLDKELNIARSIQQSILPQVIPQTANLHCGALMAPARAIGGDFFDFIPLGEDRLGVVVGDVSDKGVPSALFMALTYSLVRAEASHALTPAETLQRVNQHLLDINVSNMFVTLLYGIIDTQRGIFQYARAGHLAPLLADASGNKLAVNLRLGQALGLFDNPALDEQVIELPPGGILLLFSDGLTDAQDRAGNYFGLEYLDRILTQQSQMGAQEFCQNVWQMSQDFSTGTHQVDDFTIAAIQWAPGSQ